MPEPEVRRLQEGALRVLAWAGMLRRPAPPDGPRPTLLTGFPWVRSSVRGLFYPAVRVGDRVIAGQVVGRLCNAFGDPLAEVHAPASGVVMFVVTSLATNPGDPLLAVGTPA